MRKTAAEFFAGIGLVRLGIEQAGFEVVFANDIEPTKHALYAANFDAAHFVLGDVRQIKGHKMPDVDLATASFPCTDLSLAGWRKGLNGEQSSTFWQFARILKEMAERRPRVIMLENVASLATSARGQDLHSVIQQLNRLGYCCDLLQLDARWWVPQSRRRVFIVGCTDLPAYSNGGEAARIRPPWVANFLATHSELRMMSFPIASPPEENTTLADVVEKLSRRDLRWWDDLRLQRFVAELSGTQTARLRSLVEAPDVSWRTAYRRTRSGRPMWEIRADTISGCLRTARGGSSRQALVEAGRGDVRVRWMTPREYARLMGAPDYNFGAVTENQALFGFGDAVCVPTVAWLARNYLAPLCSGKLTVSLGATTCASE